MRRFRSFYHRLPILLALGLCGNAWAKTVNVQWKPMKGAVVYEIRVEKDGKPVVTKKVDATKWSGDLEFGVYAYSIRAYDRVKRAGAWSAPHALVVMPSRPDPSFPDDGQNITSYTPTTKTKISWKAVDGAEAYMLRVKSGAAVVHEEMVHGTEAEVKGLGAGKYTWNVSVYYQATGRSPSSLGGRKWEGKPSDESAFSVQHQDLMAPDLVYPQGTMKPPEDGTMRFQWKPVEGATAYEIRVSPKRMRADQEVKEAHWTVKTNSSSARMPGEGSYTWEVRALASVEESAPAEAVGAQSSTEFTLDRYGGFKKGSGYAAVSTLLAPYHYSASSPSIGSYTQGNLNSTAVGTRLSGEYWIHPLVGVAGMAQDVFFTINGQNFSQQDFELSSKYRFHLSEGTYPWVLQPRLGLLSRQYLLLSYRANQNGQGAMNADKFSTLGPVAGVDLRKQFSERLSLGAQFSYYFPMSCTEGSVVRGPDSNGNTSLGLQGLLWLTKYWGMGMGVYFENRKITRVTGANPTQPDSIENDQTYFFGSLIYSFGQ